MNSDLSQAHIQESVSQKCQSLSIQEFHESQQHCLQAGPLHVSSPSVCHYLGYLTFHSSIAKTQEAPEGSSESFQKVQISSLGNVPSHTQPVKNDQEMF